MSQTRETYKGPHLFYKGCGCRFSLLSDADRIHHLLEDLPDWKLLDRGSELTRDVAGSRALVEQERRRVATALGLGALR